MKRLFFALLAIMALSCSKFDDSEIWDKLNNHESRITELEKICKEMNAEIIKLQTLVSALENNDYIINASPLVTGDGYTFVFKSGKSVVVYNGKDGQNGTNGTDGVTPVISVKQDTDGIYYWTVNGEWLLVDGKKVKASATDGQNGENGTNGVTPQFKIEDDYWYVSYDNGLSWEKLGKATGSNGLNGVDGEDGDTLFKKVYIEDGYVCFELNDETSTIIRIPLMKDGTLTLTLEKAGTLAKALSSEQVRTTTSLILKGKANADDMRTIQAMTSLQKLDLSGVEFASQGDAYGGFKLNPYQDTLINRSITEVVLPKFTEYTPADFSYCLALSKVTVSSDESPLYSLPDSYEDSKNDHNYYLTLCPLFDELEYAEGVTKVREANSWCKYRELERVTYPSTMKYIPASITSYCNEVEESVISGSVRRYYYYYTIPCKVLVCKAKVPPFIDPSTYAPTVYYDTENKWCYYTTKGSTITYHSYQKAVVPSDAVLYVPSESIEAYRTAPIWENYTNILPLESLEE